MDEERRSDLSNNNKSNSPQTLGKMNDSSSSSLSINNTNNNQTNNAPCCIIDRNRMIKYASPIFQNQILNKPTRLMSNLNLFYELIKSMPELSNFEVR
jgi:hypothetical protein